ncbi:protein crumbs homolog 1-like isoform X1 [Rhincodon typus]|uniref:protein crumbs homolog 1-like isoform X1 n=1 Tax=Rhincodon typus TaxID=259920 RepID=UPI00202E0B64|nr:protein crumbs homolog 1-like isoform X1 [Rhincodon typus]
MEVERTSSQFQLSAELILLFLFIWGNLCSPDIGQCSSQPCKNGGICVEGLNDYICQCQQYPVMYTGKNCEIQFDACYFNICMNNSTCQSTPGSLQYNCTCLPGFGGTQCNININECESNPCQGVHVDCIDRVNGYNCLCSPGYEGENCTTETNECLTNSCKNNGTCLDGIGNYTCDCQPGYTGINCETDIDDCASNPCLNGALCLEGRNEYKCFCVPGYQGPNCEIDINECASRPCRNGATCIHDVDRYLCVCPPGYKGLNCEVEINECESNPCQHGGTCRDNIAFYDCLCASGYEGVDCETDIDECASNPCINRGTCKDMINGYMCNCTETGFMGTNCQMDIPECASNPCVNNGTCLEGVKSYTCLCWTGYTGSHCEVDINECATKPCLNNGTCLERSTQKYYGHLPQFKPTFSYADASGYICLCQRGFAGEHCSVNINECESGPCMNKGTCEDQNNGFKCHCAPGFTGMMCQIDINECESNPCENGGDCEDGIADYSCRCPAMDDDGVFWGGKNCSIQLDGCLEHQCDNGATCIPNLLDGTHSYNCKCPPGYYDASCSKSTTFSLFSGYVTVQVPNTNRNRTAAQDEPFSISLRFRTTIPNVLLLYRGDILTEYMHVQLYSGQLMSIAVINSQIISISFIHQVNDGEWHQLTVQMGESFQVNLTHPSCPNYTCSNSKAIDAVTLPSLHAFQTTHIGGLPGMFFPIQDYFTGCIQDLEIDNRAILPQTISKNMSLRFTLGCKKINWCRQNPCNNNGKCVDLWTNYKCDCFRPFAGPTCLHEYVSATFSNENSSSLATFIITDNPGTKFVISFFIRTRKVAGFLMQFRHGTIPYLTIYLNNSSIYIKTNVLMINSSMNLADGIKRLIEIRFDEAWVTVTASDVILLDFLLSSVKIQPFDIVQIGQDPHDSAQWGGPFKGCLQDVRLNNIQLEFYPLEEGNYSSSLDIYSNKTLVNVIEDCVSDDSCMNAPCQNGGNCTVTWNDFECQCPLVYSGRTCERKVWCETDPCPAGYRCQNLPGGYECYANATFQGENPMTYIGNKFITRDLISISMDFKTRNVDADLLQASNGAESIWFGIHNSYLQFRLYSGNSLEAITLSSNVNISDGQWHSVLITMVEPLMMSSRWTMVLNGNSNFNSPVTAGNLNFLQHNVNITLGNSFRGCLGVVKIGGIYLPYLKQNIFTDTEQFILVSKPPIHIGCFGTEVCSSNPCHNNGTCVDLFDLYQCNCMAGWEGTRCELNVDDCASTLCIHGNCSDLLEGYKCSCNLGYTGKNCESNIDDCVNHKCRNNGTCIDSINSYFCNCLHQFTGRYCEWSYPPVKCGESFSCNNGGLCTDGLWGANCTCKPGFTGVSCEEVVNECDSNPCQNGGTCHNLVNKFVCVCGDNFAGEQCELDRGKKADAVPLLAIAVPVVCGSVLLIVIALIFVVLTARKKRQTEGTYNPSQQEVAGARLEMDSVLKVPPEERLI